MLPCLRRDAAEPTPIPPPSPQAIFRILNAELDPADLNAQHTQLELRRAYFLFLHTIALSELDDVLRSDRNLASLSNVLTTVAQAASGIDDRRVQRQCFLIFEQLTKVWLHEERSADPVPGFAEFMSSHAIAACFDAPRLDGFDPQDGQVGGSFSAAYFATNS